MRRIDAHQHFWQYNEKRDAWINEDMAVIRRDFLPADLEPLLKENGIDGCVVVQSDQSPEENNFQPSNAEANSFIKGVVGWVDLRAEDLDARLEVLSGFEKLKGFRHVLQGEDPAFMLEPAFKRGIGKLSKFGFSYDLLLFPQHLVNAEKLVAEFPQQRFILDHIAKPFIRSGETKAWKKDIFSLAGHQNVSCKVSGMITEADWKSWTPDQFKPYLDIVFEAFGADRLMFGSDWPVCLVAGSYKAVVDLVSDYTGRLTESEQSAFWAGNAETFYQLT